MIHLYRVFGYLVYVLAWLWGKGKASRDPLWAGRLAVATHHAADLWLHAASVGEVRIIANLIAHLRRTNSKLTFHITVMTRTGFQTAQLLAEDGTAVSFFPLDVPLLWGRFLNQIRPKVVVIAETEIWPNLISILEQKKTPLVLVNGRLSAKAAGRYRIVRSSLARLLATYDHLFVKGADDYARLLELGVPASKMTQLGDMKFDAPLVERTSAQRKATRELLSVSPEQFVLVAGSTRPGEETLLAGLYRELSKSFPQLRLALVPRHIERTDEIMAMLQREELTASLVGDAVSPFDASIRVVNRMGLLNEIYAASDLAFVGGTLVDLGGHNLLEPVWAGTPVLFGPSIANVRDAAEYIEQHNYGAMVRDIDELKASVSGVLQGTRLFARKSNADLSHSATAQVAEHIVKLVRHA